MTWARVRRRREVERAGRPTSARRAPIGVAGLVGCLLVGAGACGAPDGEGTDDDASGPETSGVFGVAPTPSGGIPAVVTLTPTDGTESAASAAVDGRTASTVPSTTIVDQFGLQFSPTTALVQVGGTVSFTNSEAALSHNVQVRAASGGATLLDEDAVTGDRIDLPMPEAGGYDVTCDVHPGMTAFVYVTPSPYAVFAGNDGSFRFEGIPAGRYEWRIWSTDPARRSSGIVEVGEGATEVPAPGGTNVVG